ncbi:MAG: CHAD domain-containing protein [Hyphomicrobium sp.]|nr:CHAD domain-containing protein [Hyphomicrobium sp.]
MIEGIAATYRDGRRALKRAYDTPTDETIHELRKMVQAHWRHMALLSRAWPDEMSLRLEAAREVVAGARRRPRSGGACQTR